MPMGLTPSERRPILDNKIAARNNAVAPIPLPPLSLTGGAAAPAISGGGTTANQGGNIIVEPTGINLGEILRNFSGPPSNGGYGVDLWSRLFPAASFSNPSYASGGVAAANVGGGFPLWPVLLIGGGLAAFLLLRK